MEYNNLPIHPVMRTCRKGGANASWRMWSIMSSHKPTSWRVRTIRIRIKRLY